MTIGGHLCFLTYFVNESLSCDSIRFKVPLRFRMNLDLAIEALSYSTKSFRWLLLLLTLILVLRICKVLPCLNWNRTWLNFLQLLLALSPHEFFLLHGQYFMQSLSRYASQGGVIFLCFKLGLRVSFCLIFLFNI